MKRKNKARSKKDALAARKLRLAAIEKEEHVTTLAVQQERAKEKKEEKANFAAKHPLVFPGDCPLLFNELNYKSSKWRSPFFQLPSDPNEDAYKQHAGQAKCYLCQQKSGTEFWMNTSNGGGMIDCAFEKQACRALEGSGGGRRSVEATCD